jgi:hypothetical protein
MLCPEKLKPLIPYILSCVSYKHAFGPTVDGKNFHRTVKVLYRYKEISFFGCKKSIVSSLDLPEKVKLPEDKQAEYESIRAMALAAANKIPNIMHVNRFYVMPRPFLMGGRYIHSDYAVNLVPLTEVLNFDKRLSFMGVNRRGESHVVGEFDGIEVIISFRKQPVAKIKTSSKKRLVFESGKFIWRLKNES